MYHNTATRMDVIWMVLWENSVIFSPLTVAYRLLFMLWRTMNCWLFNDGRVMFDAEKALLEVPSERQRSAQRYFLELELTASQALSVVLTALEMPVMSAKIEDL